MTKVSEIPRYQEAKEIAKEWNEDLETFRKQNDLTIDDMIAMSAGNDPFWLTAGKVLKAMWAEDVMNTIIIPHLRRISADDIHLRDIHYILTGMSHAIWSGAEIYQNTTAHWGDLMTAFANARYLGLVDPSLIRDNKNKFEQRTDYRSDASFGGRVKYGKDALNNERVLDIFLSWFSYLKNWHNQMPVHIEIWAEKDLALLEQVAEKYYIDTVVGEGETSITQVYQIIDRIKKADKPVRLGYVTDCDVVGSNMSKAMARKMEFVISKLEEEGIDVKLTHLMLTPSQVEQYGLPTIPMKVSKSGAYETRKDEWMQSRGLAGAVEINSFHALFPDDFRQILENFIESYFDDEIKRMVRDFNSEQKDTISDLISNDEEINKMLDELLTALKGAIDEVDWDEKEEEYDSAFEDILDEHGEMDYSDRDAHYRWLFDSGLEYRQQLTRYLDYELGRLDNPEEDRVT